MYKATRFFDEFRPGDDVPADRYDKHALESKLKRGALVETALPRSAPKATTRKAPAKK